VKILKKYDDYLDFCVSGLVDHLAYINTFPIARPSQLGYCNPQPVLNYRSIFCRNFNKVCAVLNMKFKVQRLISFQVFKF